MVQALLIAPLMIAAFVLLPGSPAQAKTIAVTYGYGEADYNSNPLGSNYYYGFLRDTATDAGYCVEMERKTSTGDWVTTGFWDDGAEIHVVACDTTWVDWEIRNPDAVYGLRLARVKGRVVGPATAFCTTKAACLNMVDD
jgi:hypothetical protein